MMRWAHSVSADWLAARRKFLTATDIKKLASEYKRLEKKGFDFQKDIAPSFAAVWAEKNSTNPPDVEAPSSAAARGHIMEPYAIDDWNDQRGQEKPFMYHWDDCIICQWCLGFSPDAMDIRQPEGHVRLDYNDFLDLGECLSDGRGDDAEKVCDLPTRILEVKSYGPDHHMKSILEDKMDRDEAMQLAVAMLVCPSIEEAELVFYCPGAPISMFSVVYTHDDLKDLIEEARTISLAYKKQTRLLDSMAESMPMHALSTEEEIYGDYVSSMMEPFELKG